MVPKEIIDLRWEGALASDTALRQQPKRAQDAKRVLAAAALLERDAAALAAQLEQQLADCVLEGGVAEVSQSITLPYRYKVKHIV